MILSTIQLQKKRPTIIKKVDLIINPTKHKENIKIFKDNNPSEIIIYDLTSTQKENNNEEIYISDHINQTGSNPLIGQQKQTNTTFLDISNKYKSQSGITTHCIGEKFHNHHTEFSYPSYYLCHLSILAIAMGCKTIDARLINVL